MSGEALGLGVNLVGGPTVPAAVSNTDQMVLCFVDGVSPGAGGTRVARIACALRRRNASVDYIGVILAGRAVSSARRRDGRDLCA